MRKIKNSRNVVYKTFPGIFMYLSYHNFTKKSRMVKPVGKRYTVILSSCEENESMRAAARV